MITRKKYRDQYLRWHKGYEKRANTELYRLFRKWIKRIDWNNMQAGNYKFIITNAIKEEELFKAYFKIYTEIGKVHGRRVGIFTDKETKAFDLGGFLSLFTRNVAEFLRNSLWWRIRTVRESLVESIMEMMTERLERGMDMRDVAKEVKKIADDPKFTRYKAMRIARTESTAASNYAALQSAKLSPYETTKEWISASDKRTRRKPEDRYDHAEKDTEKKDIDEDFEFESSKGVVDKLQFPGDPTGEAGNVINCRCTIAIRPKRDKEGSLIPRK